MNQYFRRSLYLSGLLHFVVLVVPGLFFTLQPATIEFVDEASAAALAGPSVSWVSFLPQPHSSEMAVIPDLSRLRTDFEFLPPSFKEISLEREVNYQAPTLPKALSQARVKNSSANQPSFEARAAMGSQALMSAVGVGASGHSRAAPVRSPKPPYPWAARRAGFEGKVLLDLEVGADGRVLGCEVRRTSGREDCDNSARATILESWRFQPAKLNGFPVGSKEKVEVVYTLRQ